MKKVLFVLALAIVALAVSGCVKLPWQGDKVGGSATPTDIAQSYEFTFSLRGQISPDMNDGFLANIKKRIQSYGFNDAEVSFDDQGKIKVAFKTNPGVMLIGEDFLQYMEATPTFEIGQKNDPKNLVLSEEEKKSVADYNAGAKVKAEGLLAEALAKPESFTDLAKQNSEDPGSKDNGGAYKGVKKGAFVAEYEDVIFNKLKVGEIYQQVVETDFGYHIIKKDAETGEGDAREIDTSHILISKVTEAQAIATKEWITTGLTGLYINKVEPMKIGEAGSEFAFQVEFNEPGTTLLSQITKSNLNKQLLIVIDGTSIGAPTVSNEITDGKILITGQFTEDQVKAVAENLSAGVLNVKIVRAE